MAIACARSPATGGQSDAGRKSQSTIGSGAPAGDCAIGALLAWGQAKVERARIPCRAGGAVDAATQAARQIAYDPQAATKLDPSEARAVVGDPTVHPSARAHQLNFDFAISAIEVGMADRVRH